MGAYYPLSLLSDHGGTLFKQELTKLVQLDIRDSDNNLIPPWDMYDKLRPGTIVIIEGTLVCWHISGGESGLSKKVGNGPAPHPKLKSSLAKS